MISAPPKCLLERKTCRSNQTFSAVLVELKPSRELSVLKKTFFFKVGSDLMDRDSSSIVEVIKSFMMISLDLKETDFLCKYY